MSRILTLIDPLSLIGREVIRLMDEGEETAFELRALHTSTEEEHQVAELVGEAALVAPLRSIENLEGSSAILVASEDPDAELRLLEEFVSLNPQVPLIIAGPIEGVGIRPMPVGHISGERPDPPHMRIAHPCLVAAQALTGALSHFGITSIAITSMEPVSAFGGEAVEILANQAIERLNGQAVQDTIDGLTAAFSTIVLDEGQLVEDAAFLWPSFQVTVSRLLSGNFHGHLAQVSLTCEHPVDRNELFEALESQPILTLAEAPVGTDMVTDANGVFVVPSPSSADDRHLGFTLMVDGLRIGGALTALRIAESTT